LNFISHSGLPPRHTDSFQPSISPSVLISTLHHPKLWKIGRLEVTGFATSSLSALSRARAYYQGMLDPVALTIFYFQSRTNCRWTTLLYRNKILHFPLTSHSTPPPPSQSHHLCLDSKAMFTFFNDLAAIRSHGLAELKLSSATLQLMSAAPSSVVYIRIRDMYIGKQRRHVSPCPPTRVVASPRNGGDASGEPHPDCLSGNDERRRAPRCGLEGEPLGRT
jgi:hypothetical protein